MAKNLHMNLFSELNIKLLELKWWRHRCEWWRHKSIFWVLFILAQKN